MPEEKNEISKELEEALVGIFKDYEKEDKEVRSAQVRAWKKNEEFWRGVQYLFWSTQDSSWKSAVDVNWGESDELDGMEELGSSYDYVINIFRGHGEAIIAALSAQIPSLRFVPDDADDVDDCLTAKTYDKIGDLIQRHNKVKLLALKAFWYLYLNGIVAGYVYKDSDFKYGSYKIPEFDTQEQEVDSLTCPECGKPFEGFDATTLPNELQCQDCGEAVTPKVEKKKQSIPVNKGYKTLPKTRVKIDLFGGLQVKVPHYARNQEECPYLIHYSDIPKESAIEAYTDLEEDIRNDYLDTYDRFSRTDYTFPTDPETEQRNLITIYKCWLRPVAFNRIIDKKLRAEAKESFTSGCRLEIIGRNKKFGRVEEEDIDDRWRIGAAGLAPFIHADPVCNPILSIQEMRNTLANLSIETIEHGMPSVFADPRVVNFDTYDKFEADPAYVYKTLPGKPGGRIADAFYETPRAQLSKEVPVFTKQLDTDAQFVLGAFPSVIGAPQGRDRATLGEYQQSRQQALQRLQITWQFFVDWFKGMIENSVRLFVDTIVEDERYVVQENNNYVNVWIRQEELSGKVGGCESEADTSFPVSLVQKKAIIMELMQLNNDYINAALYTPENAEILQSVLALNEMHLPGEDQRFKQMLEIKQLVSSEPIGENESSVPTDPDIDDDAVHVASCRAYLVSPSGMDLKRTNPAGYQNVVLHMRMHIMSLKIKTTGDGETPAGQPPNSSHFGQGQ